MGNLLKRARARYGFQSPLHTSLAQRVVDTSRLDTKRNHKIAWFFLFAIPDLLDTLCSLPKNIRYWLGCRLIPSERYHVINTGLPPDYYDIDILMLHACMVLLCRYVEQEMEGEAFLKQYIASMLVDYDNEGRSIFNDDSQIRVCSEALEIYRWWKAGGNKDDGSEEASEMLLRLIKIRRSLWT